MADNGTVEHSEGDGSDRAARVCQLGLDDILTVEISRRDQAHVRRQILSPRRLFRCTIR